MFGLKSFAVRAFALLRDFPGLVPLRVLLLRTGDAAARRQVSVFLIGPLLGTVLAAGLGDPGLVPLRVLLLCTGDATARCQVSVFVFGSFPGTVLAAGLVDPGLV